jgi:hypothetical protein
VMPRKRKADGDGYANRMQAMIRRGEGCEFLNA